MSGFTPSTTATLAAGTSSQTLLLALVALLGLVIIGLVAMAMVMRRRARVVPAPTPELPRPAPLTPAPPITPRPRTRPAVARGGGGAGLAVVASTSSAMVCPTCRTEYHGMTYCTRDARRLVAPEEMIAASNASLMSGRGMGRSAGLVCMACRRAYEPGLRACPHDGNELVPFSVYNATRPRSRAKTSDPTGVIARICPVCSSKYDLNARFCGHDAGELVVIN